MQRRLIGLVVCTWLTALSAAHPAWAARPDAVRRAVATGQDAVGAYIKGDFAGALRLYREATALDPVNADFLYGVAKSADKLGDATTALAAYRKFLVLAPASHERIANARSAIERLSPPPPPPAPVDPADEAFEAASRAEQKGDANKACSLFTKFVELARIGDSRLPRAQTKLKVCREPPPPPPPDPASEAHGIAFRAEQAGDSAMACSNYKMFLKLALSGDPRIAHARTYLQGCDLPPPPPPPGPSPPAPARWPARVILGVAGAFAITGAVFAISAAATDADADKYRFAGSRTFDPAKISESGAHERLRTIEARWTYAAVFGGCAIATGAISTWLHVRTPSVATDGKSVVLAWVF